MYIDRAEISPKKLWKISTAFILCLLLIAVPLIDRCHAVAAVDDVAVLILLTILLSMGISLVLGSSETPDQFFSEKFPLFKQQHDTQIVEQTIGAWLLADIQQTAISLKDGILSLPKTVVSKAKEFIAWLIPNPQSDTIHDFSSGADVPSLGSIVITKCTVDNSNSFGTRFIWSSIGSVIFLDQADTVLTDGSCEVSFSILPNRPNEIVMNAHNPYSALDGSSLTGDTYVGPRGSGFVIVMMEEPFQYYRSGTLVTFRPGFYIIEKNTDYWSNASPVPSIFVNGTYVPYYVFNLDFLPTPEVTDSAVIGQYDDISGIKDVTKDINGTTIVENQFQISSAGQALNPSGETLDDLINALRDAIENLNQCAEVTAVTDAVAEAGTVTPDYGDFDLGQLNLSGLGALLTTRFPFSIPWDLGRIFGLFVADPEPPRWEFDLIPIEALSGVDTTITLDLGEYPIVGQISRWFCIIDLCIGLCYVTKRLIWVA